MKVIQFGLGSILLVVLFATASMAQAGRTFVSGAGLDTNPCSLTSPCRTFTQAISQTNAGGEVIVLTSAGYGPFTISKAVTVEAPAGVYAGITVNGGSGDGIDINAGPSDTVILRGLTVNNQGSTGSGIVFNTGGTLHIESCVVNRFSTNFSSGLAFSGPAILEVKDSLFRGNGTGIFIPPPSSQLTLVTIDHVRLERNRVGLEADENSRVSVSDSIASGNVDGFSAVDGAIMNLVKCVASNNSQNGIVGESVSIPCLVTVEGCMVCGNGTGINANQQSTGVATARVSNSTVTGNVSGILNQNGVVLSRLNNTVEGNGVDVTGAISSYTAK
jgi:hypothetical protein